MAFVELVVFLIFLADSKAHPCRQNALNPNVWRRNSEIPDPVIEIIEDALHFAAQILNPTAAISSPLFGPCNVYARHDPPPRFDRNQCRIALQRNGRCCFYRGAERSASFPRSHTPCQAVGACHGPWLPDPPGGAGSRYLLEITSKPRIFSNYRGAQPATVTLSTMRRVADRRCLDCGGVEVDQPSPPMSD